MMIKIKTRKSKPKRLFSHSRQRSLTSQLFDDSLEASTESGIIMNDEKMKASRRLERRKTLRSEGNNNKQPATISTKKIKRERSLTTKLTHKNIAAEVALDSRLSERRRSSQIRLAERIKELKKGKSNVEKVNDNKDNTKSVNGE